MTTQNNSHLVDIAELTRVYLPMSRRKARRFVSLYLDCKRIGNRIYVERDKLEALLHDSDRDDFPLNL